MNGCRRRKASREGLRFDVIRAGRQVIDARADAAIRSAGDPGPNSSLTPREREVLLLLAQGMSSKAIATDLGIAPNTVRGYCQSVLHKLKATSRLQALAAARERGLV